MSAPQHTGRAHSKLGASIAHRWINCPGSVAACRDLPDEQSVYAAEGTAAHELAEEALNVALGPNALGFEAFDLIGREYVVGNHGFTVDEEMAEAVQVYVDTIREDFEPGDVVKVEARFSLEDIRHGMYGTNDALRYRPSTKTLTVYDYKHGQGKVVEVAGNPQLLYYGLGAALNHNWPLETVELVIVQPRARHPDGPVRRWSTDALWLIEWAGDLKLAAARTDDPDAPLVAGDWCKFCPNGGTCPALREQALASARMEFSATPGDLSDQALADILEEAALVEEWVSSVRSEAFRRAEAGSPPPGWKLVQKVGRRKFVERDDPERVGHALQVRYGLEDEQVFARTLRTPAQIEKLIPKALRPTLAELIETVSSGTTLARESDRRAPVTASTAASDFGLE